jgi:twinkle protein
VRCPNCKKLGKEHWKDTCLSINTERGIYNCHKCSWKGTVKKFEKMREYTKPNKINMKNLSEKGRKFLNDRGITDEVIDKNKIVSSSDDRNIYFPYFKNGEFLCTS